MSKINKHGRVIRRTKRGHLASPWNDNKIRRCRAMYVDMGLSMRATAANLGLAHSTVQRLVESKNWVRTKRAQSDHWWNVVNTNIRRIEKWYLSGVQTSEIMRRLKIGNAHRFMTWLNTQPYYDRWERNKLGQRNGTLRLIKEKLLVDINLLSGDQYSRLARSLTYNVFVMWKHVIPDSDKQGVFTMHLDHKFSVYDATFYWSDKRQRLVRRKKPMPLRFLCHPANMQMLTAIANAHKGASSCITFKQLKADIKIFEKIHGKVFK